MKYGPKILKVLISASVALVWLGIAMNIFGYQINELHYFSGIFIFVLVESAWERLQPRFEYAICAAVVVLSLLVYPLLTDGPRRERRADRELIQKMAVEKASAVENNSSPDAK
ncbi:MAG: hypothetical protein J0L82_17595 [Deltaproteobacteria bacterium]|jgi:hypothetical protein|nr:hypothetical protein [Deltaproteobacteria bacterium]